MSELKPDEQCSQMVKGEGQYGWLPSHKHQCTRRIWKDGKCKVHHSETIKARRDERDKQREIKWENSDWKKLYRANKQITRLRELCGDVWVSIPEYVSYHDWCTLRKRYEQRLKDEGVATE